jgi:hypothetical protein
VTFRNTGPDESGHTSAVPTIYVYMPEEAEDVWRPVEAEAESDSVYRIADTHTPPDEVWEFPPGTRVRCEWRELPEGPALVAVSPA